MLPTVVDDAAEERRRRYRSLGMGELASAAVFVVAATTFVGLPTLSSAGVWIALTPPLIVLLQGGAFWLLARRWVVGGRHAAAAGTAVRLFRIVDPLLLVAAAVGALWWRSDLIGSTLMALDVQQGLVSPDRTRFDRKRSSD